MQKEPKSIIISKLRERGCRITRQRRIILDIILDEDCSCCKEIYYKACKQDSSIGAATVYRMVNTLEEIGVCRFPDAPSERAVKHLEELSDAK